MTNEKYIEQARKTIKESFTKDLLLIQTYNSLQDLKNNFNSLMLRFRDWMNLYNPEIANELADNEKLLNADFSKRVKNTMGGEFSKDDLKYLKDHQTVLKNLCSEIKDLETYLEDLIKTICPKIYETIGIMGAQLLAKAGSLERLAKLPSSTIQIIGAEKSFFRYLTKGTKGPKYGILLNHEFVQKSKDKGKAARQLANKISIVAKIDYFNFLEFGAKLLTRKKLEKKNTEVKKFE